MESLFQTIKVKGISTTFKKMCLNLRRYRLGTKKTMERFNLIAQILKENNAKMTIHVPAVLLEHHLNDFNKIDDENIEWAMHGYKHIDHTKLSYDECFNQLKKAKEIFDNSGIKNIGFRAPYLQSNDNVLKAISKLGMAYDSSSSVFIKVVDDNNMKVKKILNFYDSDRDWKISDRYNIKVIPVILPDDEILVDRLGFKGETIGNMWLKVAKICFKKKWIFVVQLHPDRVEICSQGLNMVLNWAQKNQIWLPSLSEIVKENGIKNGYKGAIAITGDLDLFSIWDYYRIS
jgi:peptidoglycan/xylan/chitin deacetylase (PgdA/CDA1 family)